METTLLTGATGFIGQWVLHRVMADAGVTIRVLTRKRPAPALLDYPGVQIVEGDLLNTDSLDAALAGVSSVYHLAGKIDFKWQHGDRVRAINFDGTLNLMRAAQRAGVRRIVYTASIFALGFTSDGSRSGLVAPDFNAHHLLDIPYIRAKHDVELSLSDMVARELPLIRVYPGLCLGPGDWYRSSSGLVDLWLKGELPAIIQGGGIGLIDVRDAAEALVAAMDKGTIGKQYVVGGYNVTLVELFDSLTKLTGRARSPLQLPPALGIRLVQIAEKLKLFPALDSAQARLMAHRWWFDSTAAAQELSIVFRPLDDTLRDTIEWLRFNPMPLG